MSRDPRNSADLYSAVALLYEAFAGCALEPGLLRARNRGRLKLNLSFTLPPGASATLVVRRVFWFAVESRRSGAPVGRPWGGPLSESPRPAAAPDATPRPAGRRQRVGFLEQQRRKKEAREARRQAHASGRKK